MPCRKLIFLKNPKKLSFPPFPHPSQNLSLFFLGPTKCPHLAEGPITSKWSEFPSFNVDMDDQNHPNLDTCVRTTLKPNVSVSVFNPIHCICIVLEN
jgi:hypothetical protein